PNMKIPPTRHALDWRKLWIVLLCGGLFAGVAQAQDATPAPGPARKVPRPGQSMAGEQSVSDKQSVLDFGAAAAAKKLSPSKAVVKSKPLLHPRANRNGAPVAADMTVPRSSTRVKSVTAFPVSSTEAGQSSPNAAKALATPKALGLPPSPTPTASFKGIVDNGGNY